MADSPPTIEVDRQKLESFFRWLLGSDVPSLPVETDLPSINDPCLSCSLLLSPVNVGPTNWEVEPTVTGDALGPYWTPPIPLDLDTTFSETVSPTTDNTASPTTTSPTTTTTTFPTTTAPMRTSPTTTSLVTASTTTSQSPATTDPSATTAFPDAVGPLATSSSSSIDEATATGTGEQLNVSPSTDKSVSEATSVGVKDPGVIAGLTVGALVILALIGFLLFFLFRRRRRARQGGEEFQSYISGPVGPVQSSQDIPASYYDYDRDWSSSAEKGLPPCPSDETLCEKGSIGDTKVPHIPPPPQVHLDLAPERMSVSLPPGDPFRSGADSRQFDSVLDFYHSDSRASRPQTQLTRSNTMWSTASGLAYDQPEIPPLPPLTAEKDHQYHYNRRSEIGQDTLAYYEDQDDHMRDVRITPPVSPSLDPANTAPLNIRRTETQRVHHLLLARSPNSNSRPRDSYMSFREEDDMARLTQPSEAAEVDQSRNKWLPSLPAFLQRKGSGSQSPA